MAKPSRSLEEIVDLQDKAISALTQANLALQLALEAIQSARREVGTPLQFQFAQPNLLSPSYPQSGSASGGATSNGLPKGVWINGSSLEHTYASLTTTGKTLSSSAETYKGMLENWKSEYEKLSEESGTESNSVALKGCVQ